jgi:hypothetical protein
MSIDRKGILTGQKGDSPLFVELIAFPAEFYAFLTSIFFTDMFFLWSAARFFKQEESNLVRPQKPSCFYNHFSVSNFASSSDLKSL